MSTNLYAIALLPVMGLAIGFALTCVAPGASVKRTVSVSVPQPRPVLRNGAGQIIEPVFAPPAAAQHA